MSFSVRVTIQDGKAEAHLSGDVPEGEFAVAGHANGAQRSLSVTQQDATGRLILVASANAYREAT